jgi:hypothetical protein
MGGTMAARTNPRRESATTILQIAIADLLQTQAHFMRDSEEHRKRIDERFNRIEALLLKHNEILQNLPEAIRDKIGFKPRA